MVVALFRVLPPWACLPGAFVAYFIPIFVLGDIHFRGVNGFPFLTLSKILGAVAALACLFGGWEGWRRRKRQQAFVGETVDLTWVNRLSWQDFEHQLAEVYRQDGYLVQECGGSGPDGGVDLRLIRGAERVLVQCKHWKSWKVGAPVVRELYGVLVAEGANRAILVTSGRIFQEAQAFAHGKPIELVAGDKLLLLLRRFQRQVATALGTNVSAAPPAVPAQTDSPAPSCPRCGQTMLLRVAKQGANAGTSFWGCPQFPKCRGTRPHPSQPCQ